MGDLKTCVHCNEEKPEEDFPYHTKPRRRRDCRECVNAKKVEYRSAHPDRVRAANQKHYVKNAPALNERSKKYRLENAEAIKAQARQRYVAHREAICARNREYQDAHREEMRQYLRDWRQTPRGKAVERANARGIKYPHTRVQAFPWRTLGPRDGWKCHICGQGIPERYITGCKYDNSDPLAPCTDHVIPLSRGGEHSADNIKLAHRLCNGRKRDKLMEEL